MEVIGEDAEAQQIDPEISSKMCQPLFEPLFSVVVVPSGNGITAHQKASPDATLDHVSDGDFLRIKDFRARSKSHGSFSASR